MRAVSMAQLPAHIHPSPPPVFVASQHVFLPPAALTEAVTAAAHAATASTAQTSADVDAYKPIPQAVAALPIVGPTRPIAQRPSKLLTLTQPEAVALLDALRHANANSNQLPPSTAALVDSMLLPAAESLVRQFGDAVKASALRSKINAHNIAGTKVGATLH